MPVAVALPAGAATVYGENFDNVGFRGSVRPLTGDPVGNVCERWGTDTAYFNINNFDGWTFTGASELAVQPSTGNQAVLLNEEPGGAVATTTVGNLTPNAFYTLSFNISGDNRPDPPWGSYVFLLDVNGQNLVNEAGSWSVANPAGHPQSVEVQANASGQLNLEFYQNSPGSASPILDDVVVSTPDGGLTVAMLGMGISGLAFIRRKIQS